MLAWQIKLVCQQALDVIKHHSSSQCVRVCVCLITVSFFTDTFLHRVCVCVCLCIIYDTDRFLILKKIFIKLLLSLWFLCYYLLIFSTDHCPANPLKNESAVTHHNIINIQSAVLWSLLVTILLSFKIQHIYFWKWVPIHWISSGRRLKCPSTCAAHRDGT